MTWRPSDRADHQTAALWAVCAALFVALRPVWLAGSSFLPPCVFRLVTGWPCPGCGTTRAMERLLHADVVRALGFNPLATLAAVAFVCGGLAVPLWLAAAGRVPVIAPRPRPWLGTLLAAAFLGNWAWLIARGV